MVKPSNQLQLTLQAAGQSLTRPRQIVFEALQDMEPMTMHDLSVACQDKVDRASIYRTIAVFEKLGIAQRLQIGWKYRIELSNAFQEHHHHLTCRVCGKIIPLHEDTALEERLSIVAASYSFKADDHQLEIRGVCSDCQKK
jgi:Fur family ferric uptake transcriptional regulator